MTVSLFDRLALDPAILKALHEEGYQTPTEVQSSAIPHALAGEDVLALARTGTGKTAAFSLPLLHRLAHTRDAGPPAIRALILTPTRELALQVHASIRAYGRHLRVRAAVVLGGVGMGGQISELRKRPDILVATPGRLLDHLAQGHARLDKVEYLVLDEADRMLDMGFIHDVRKIVSHVSKERQTLFFSATMPAEVANLAASMLRNPVRVEAAPSGALPTRIAQKVYMVDRGNKQKLLEYVLRLPEVQRVLVFSRTKHRADRIAKTLKRVGIAADAIHSNKAQGARQRALAAFASGQCKVLVATDIVARGIDVEGISHIVNFDLADTPENHVHRIGRTARAGAGGIALTFCDREEVPQLRAVERLTKEKLTVETDNPFPPGTAASPAETGAEGAGPMRERTSTQHHQPSRAPSSRQHRAHRSPHGAPRRRGRGRAR